MAKKKLLKKAREEAELIKRYSVLMNHDYITIHVNKLLLYLSNIDTENTHEDWPSSFS